MATATLCIWIVATGLWATAYGLATRRWALPGVAATVAALMLLLTLLNAAT